MATLVLSAAGAALGAGFGGTILGLSGAVIGRVVGATLGRVIDQRLMGGSDAVESGRIDRLRLTSTGEGEPIARLWGRGRIAGHVIWASPYQEHSTTRGGGKSGPRVTDYSYSLSLAIGLCEGPLLTLGRIWANGEEIAPNSLTLRVYSGTETQEPDPKIAAIEGMDQAPAYRGLAYVVIEDLDLSPWGNRVPLFSFELVRAVEEMGLQEAIKGVAMIPGTGEYALATSKVHFDHGLGAGEMSNAHSHSGLSNFETSLGHLNGELPHCESVSLVVSWFGDDLRAGHCRLRPKVEQKERDGQGMAWRAGGITRAQAEVIPRLEGRSVYGGTPSDQSVIEAIKALRSAGKEVMFYPFILMDQMAGNALPNPWTGQLGQPVMPWRGRLTSALAPGLADSPDRSALAEAEVAAFFGTALASDFTRHGDLISYHGPQEWGFRRFILHYAHLCAAAGGVEAFCIGSEMVGLTHIRGAGDSFPAVTALCTLASELRAILGADCKLSYAADWTEYGSYVADGNVYFPLDPLWAHPEIDFIGIDNYLPMSDWREGDDHADAAWLSPYNLDYLKANIAGGEYYDWYYDSPEGEAAQKRLAITDGAYDEPWIYRLKDLRSWWGLAHFERRAGLRQSEPSAWQPMSKPIRFTEYGCAALSNGANQPNRFLDLFSSEASLPRASDGRRDDLMQMQYLRAFAAYWREGDHNPHSALYEGAMVDLAHCYVWAWDARPFPQFPALSEVWADAQSYGRGHWLNGRATNQPLGAVIAAICAEVGLSVDVSRCYGALRGYLQQGVESARATLQPLLLAYGVEVSERQGCLIFEMRGNGPAIALASEDLALQEGESSLRHHRASAPERVGSMRLSYLEAEASYEIATAQARPMDEPLGSVAGSEMPLVLTNAEAKAISHRWLAESAIARDRLHLALPPSRLDVMAGKVIAFEGDFYRVDGVEIGAQRLIEATKHEPSLYTYGEFTDTPIELPRANPHLPSLPLFLDLPLMSGEEQPHQPHIALSARPWPGPMGLWQAAPEGGFRLDQIVQSRAIIGLTETGLPAAPAGLWDRGAPLRLRLNGTELRSVSQEQLLNGANLMAIGDGSPDGWELIQFAQAELIGADTWHIWDRLRGQAGSDGIMPDLWPAGSYVVLINAALHQIGMALEGRGLTREWRIGLAHLGFDAPNVIAQSHAFKGNGLRPYPVCHLRQRGDLITWVRRTRKGGDSWDQIEVPLAEEREAYVLRLFSGSQLLQEHYLDQPQYLYDPLAGANRVAVAQISQTYGAGPYRWLEISL